MSKLTESLPVDATQATLPALRQDASTAVLDNPAHHIEHEVRRRLMAHPRLKIDSLVVRRIDRGICLQGTVDSIEATRDICSLVSSVDGVKRVMNRLLVASKH